MKKQLQNVKFKLAKRAGAVTALAIAPMAAFADPISPSISWSDVFGSIVTEATAMIGAAWVPLIAITGGFILMKIGKRAMNKAT